MAKSFSKTTVRKSLSPQAQRRPPGRRQRNASSSSRFTSPETLKSPGDLRKYRSFFRKAHLERLVHEHRAKLLSLQLADDVELASLTLEKLGKVRLPKGRPLQAQVHALLASYPLVKLEQVYPIV